jgi:hypothetical protein
MSERQGAAGNAVVAEGKGSCLQRW